MLRSLLLLSIILALPPAVGLAAADQKPGVPAGRWIVVLNDGAQEICDIREDGTVSLVELAASQPAADDVSPVKLQGTSLGFAQVRDGKIFIEFQEQAERWTRNGAKMAVERWADKRQVADKPATAGVGERAAAKGLQMTLRLERKEYRVDEPVTLEGVIENTGDAEVYLGMLADDFHLFTFAVSYVGGGRSVGGMVPLTRYGADLLAVPGDASKNFAIRLKPGERRPYRFALNRMVDMSISGTYSIVLVRKVPSAEKAPANRPAAPGDVLVSNELRVEITEPPDRAR